MTPHRAAGSGAVLALASLLGSAAAVDRPISGASLTIRRSASGRERMVFVSKDPAALFPALGSLDDPATGSPGGALIELFSENDSAGGAFVVPPGLGTPGWVVRDATVDQYKFSNRAAPAGPSPVKTLLLKQGARLRVNAAATGLALSGPQGSVAIRITTGAQRNCARFDAATIRADEPGKFIARGALASSLADCNFETTLDRPADPVVLTGADVPGLTGIAPGALVAFRYSGQWVQVPVQVDERALVAFAAVYNHLGGYGGTVAAPQYTDPATFTGPDPDPTLDADDEIVFMARDVGGHAPAGAGLPPGVVPGSGIQIAVTDPLAAGAGWLYLFRQTGLLDPAAGQQYVAYNFTLLSGGYLATYHIGSGPNPEDSTVLTPAYARHFSDRWVQDRLHILAGGASGADILDRHKNLFAPGNCGRSEDTFSSAEGAFIINKTGPVRAIRSYVGANSGPLTQRDHLFYDRREDIHTTLRVHAVSGMMDFFDYGPAAAGMLYRNEWNPGGVPIDGVPDVPVPGAPSWEMVTGPQGSLVIAGGVETDIAGLLPTSYYLDDTTPPVTQCTGDAFAYGASGLWINQGLPNTDPRNPPYKNLRGTRVLYYEPPGLDAAGAALRRDRALAPLVPAVTAWP